MISLQKQKSLLLVIIFPLLFISCKNGNTNNTDPETIGLAAADFILSLQNSDGRIMDCPESDVANEDSNMEYACIGLAAAYSYSQKSKYLDALTKAITWLASREEMTTPDWKGSWYLAYSVNPPYNPYPISPGSGIDDVRGVDATSALFVYLLYLHKTLSGDSTLSVLYEDNARAALDFILNKNYDSARYFYSSWQKSSGVWSIWDYRYTADQADVYLGLRAGYLLYGDTAYGNAADAIKNNAAGDFFYSATGRFATGIESDGSIDEGFEEFNTIFPQGYFTWVFGESTQSKSAYSWLKSKVTDSGGLYCYSGDPGYSLSVAVLALAAHSLNRETPSSSFEWIASETYDPDDGGIRDTGNGDKEKFSNVAGFTAAAMLGFDPF